MAKKRSITIRKFKVTDAGADLLADVTFNVKHDAETYAKGDEGHSYSLTYDLTFTHDECAHKVLNSVIIADQNSRLRALSPSECKSLIEGKVRMTKDVYPGRGAVKVVKEMSPEEIRAKCKTDPEFRKNLMAQLMEMEDETV